ncbi:hypothetical protein BV898_18482 [Hypsibius exemplaris]|uniref:Uncharacterized protein n=1 Tax=Hypsibius exemplaris TaxID=2072580 RepID=A0A9X6NJS6_HYPEX|nr:hypothetical protein BV898_18482 [Hypsibius exemplaris]
MQILVTFLALLSPEWLNVRKTLPLKKSFPVSLHKHDRPKSQKPQPDWEQHPEGPHYRSEDQHGPNEIAGTSGGEEYREPLTYEKIHGIPRRRRQTDRILGHY